MGVIQNLFNFLMGKASSENGIDTASIQSVIQDEVLFYTVTDTMTIVMGYVEMKYLSMDIDDQISIAWVICSYQEQEFIWK